MDASASRRYAAAAIFTFLPDDDLFLAHISLVLGDRAYLCVVDLVRIHLVAKCERFDQPRSHA